MGNHIYDEGEGAVGEYDEVDCTVRSYDEADCTEGRLNMYPIFFANAFPSPMQGGRYEGDSHSATVYD